MPLKVGNTWSYQVTYGMVTRLAKLEVVRPVPVAEATGFELHGPLGVSRLAWSHGSLVTDCSSSMRFSPPLVLLPSNGESYHWKGTAQWMGRPVKSTADLTEDTDKISVGPRTITATRTTMLFHLGKRTMQLTTWFEPMVGIVKQEQRTGPKLDVGLEMAEGP